ncbi:MAG: carbohydrate ABC transporter permease [Bacteroidota bacterium]
MFYVVLAFVLFVFTFPIIWTVTTSMKTEAEAFSMPPVWIFNPTFVNYRSIFTKQPFAEYIVNSVIVGLASTAVSLIVGVPAAYGLSRFRLKRGGDIAFYILSTRIAPPTLVILPFFLLFQRMSLLDTRTSLVVVYLTFNLSFVVWTMKLFFDEIPRELDEAALVDGCSRFGGFLRVVLPLSFSGLSATAILCLIASWNEFLFALVLTGNKAKTLPIAVTSFIQFTGTRWGELCAAATVMMIPLIVFGFIVQRKIVSGMTFGALK